MVAVLNEIINYSCCLCRSLRIGAFEELPDRRRHVLAFFQVGIEACASSHYWSRELQALGHTVHLMPPAYVKPYVKRQKNDAADAEAICEAVTRPNMRFVPTKTVEQVHHRGAHRDPLCQNPCAGKSPISMRA